MVNPCFKDKPCTNNEYSILSVLVVFAMVMSFTQTGHSAEVKTYTSDAIYNATLAACRNVTPDEARGHAGGWPTSRESFSKIENMRAGIFPSTEFNRLLGTLSKPAVDLSGYESISAQQVLKTPGFHRALADCYPDDFTARQFFSQSIIHAESRGRNFKLMMLTLLIGITGGLGGTTSVAVQTTNGVANLSVWTHRASVALQYIERGFTALFLTSLSGDSIREQKRPTIELKPEMFLSQGHTGGDIDVNKNNELYAIRLLLEVSEREVADLEAVLKRETSTEKRRQIESHLRGAQLNITEMRTALNQVN